MSVRVDASSHLTVTEAFESTSAPFVDTTGLKGMVHSGLDEDVAWNAGTTPAVTNVVSMQAALTAGAATINLASLTGSSGQAVVGTGKKVKLIKFRNPSTNTGSITISKGASNGHTLFGAAWTFTLKPGQSAGPFIMGDAAPAIAGGDRTIDLAGTGTEALDVLTVLG